MSISIEIKNVRKSFRNHVVLNDVNMEMTGGRIYGIVGRNGSGKTVLMKCICGFMPVDSGKIMVNGQDISSHHLISPDIGAVIEVPGFLPYLSGFANLKTLAMLRKKAEDRTIAELMRALDLDPESRMRTGKYSLGMKQKLGIIQAIMEDPPIIMLDEPMNSLDLDSVSKVRSILLQKKQEGKLILIASHIREDIDHLCDEVYAITDGVVAKETVML